MFLFYIFGLGQTVDNRRDIQEEGRPGTDQGGDIHRGKIMHEQQNQTETNP